MLPLSGKATILDTIDDSIRRVNEEEGAVDAHQSCYYSTVVWQKRAFPCYVDYDKAQQVVGHLLHWDSI